MSSHHNIETKFLGELVVITTHSLNRKDEIFRKEFCYGTQVMFHFPVFNLLENRRDITSTAIWWLIAYEQVVSIKCENHKVKECDKVIFPTSFAELHLSNARKYHVSLKHIGGLVCIYMGLAVFFHVLVSKPKVYQEYLRVSIQTAHSINHYIF